MPIKIGLIGLGVMGNNHLNTLKTIPEVSILGVCDQIKLSDSPSIVCYGKTEELLEKNPDGIIIATPTSTHKNIALSCLKKNIPVLIEKPVASTAKEAKEILSLLEKKSIGEGENPVCG